MKFINRNLFFIIFTSLLLSQQISAPITIDGQFEDWELVNIAYVDEVGDESEEDFEIIKISNDNNFLFFYLEFENDEILMQDWNEIHLFIDADSNLETGYLVHGIGAETGTQAILLAATVGATSALTGSFLLIAFVIGLLLSNTLITIAAISGLLGGDRHPKLHLGLGICVASFSLILGFMFVMGKTQNLPSFFA